MLDVVTNSMVGMVLRLLPGFMLKRFFKLSQLEKEFEFTLSSASPVKISTNPYNPYVEVRLRFVNKSAIPVVVDRVLFEVGIIPAEFANLYRRSVKSKETVDYIHTRHWLNELQRQSVERQLDQNKRLAQTVTVSATVIGDSPIGPFLFVNHFQISGDSMPPV